MNFTKDWYCSLIENLKPFADKEFQIKVWLNGEGDEISSFSEASCQLFDDTALDYYLNDTNKIIVSTECHKILCEISNLINSIDENQKTKDIIEHQNMSKIRKLSKDAIIILKSYITNIE